MERYTPGYFLLEDGRRFDGRLYAAVRPAIGEVVFNTSLTGYQEVLYDPSYWGQIVVMTGAHIGNTGVNRHDAESGRVYVTGFAARNFSEPSNFRSEMPLEKLLHDNQIPAIFDLDTRALTRHLRQFGAVRGGIFPCEVHPRSALEQVKAHPSMAGLDGASAVSCSEPYDWSQGVDPLWGGSGTIVTDERLRVAVWDLGVKHNILRRVVDVGCEVRVFPISAEPGDIEAYNPQGVLLSNGPGDPAAVKGIRDKVRHFIGGVPIFGICLGHQLLALANNGVTYKMKFGHRGINQPVAERADGRVYITVHNHGFAVADDSLPDGGRVTYRSLNDGTIEGLDYPDMNAFSVQYHPEASPGPHDAADLFREFRRRMVEF